ncbi:MAG TPA: glycosyltransferase family 9 protein, partial [Fimbriimonadaceae bacterium]|nr:glycosyltransferase family 9 protein [Fimbriimonadaceae bacterium]
MRGERTIVLLKQFLGDGVMAEPLLTVLAENYSYVDVLALPPVQQVLGQLDGRVSFIHMEKMKTLRDTMRQARKVRLKGYDVAFLVNRSFRSAILARLAKIPIRVGHGTEGRSFLLTRSVTYRDDDFEAVSYAD